MNAILNLLAFVMTSLVLLLGDGVNAVPGKITSSAYSAIYQKGTACNGDFYGTTKFLSPDGQCLSTQPTTIYNLEITFNSMLSNCSLSELYHFYSDTSCKTQVYQASSTCVQGINDD